MKKVFLSFILLLAAVPSFCCTTVIVSAKASASGRPLLWKQRDSSTELNCVEHFDGPGHAFTGIVNSSDIARESVWGGANDAGFGIMNSQSYGLSPVIRPDSQRIWEGVIMKRALMTCVTVDDFQKLLDGLSSPNFLEANFGVIDAYGAAAYFEVHDNGYRRFDVTDGEYAIRTNYSLTGREGEGKGYDRYEFASGKMAGMNGGFTPEWLIDNIGRDPLVARKNTVSSFVIEGVGKDDRKDSSVIWCALGNPRFSYIVPVWVSAGKDIPSFLASENGSGAELNTLAVSLKKLNKDVLSIVKERETIEINEGKNRDAIFRKKGFFSEVVAEYNEAALERFNKFKSKISL